MQAHLNKLKFPNVILLLYLLCLYLFLVGCASKKNCFISTEKTLIEKMSILSDNLNVDVYLDATSSMKGFVDTETPSFYQRTLPFLESAVTEGWKDGQVSFYKFGTTIEPLPERNYLTARDSKFYDLNKEGDKTFLQTIVDSAQPTHLSVIITDLFQDNSDVNQVASKIRDKFISQNLAVGVFALKSQFKGTVYDVGPNNDKFTYANRANEDSSMRPFYLIVLGSHTDIAHYFNQLGQSEIKNFPVKNAVIFSPYLGKPAIAFRDASVENDKVNDITGNLSNQNPNSELFKDFNIVGNPQTASFTVKYDYEPLPYTVSFNPNIKADIAALTCQNSDSQSGGNRALQVKSIVFNQNENIASVEFTGELTPSEIPDRGIYPYKITLFPQDFVLPAWINEWDMDISQLNKWRKSPELFEGSKTYNLKNFLNNLWMTTQRFQKPVLSEQFVVFSRS